MSALSPLPPLGPQGGGEASDVEAAAVVVQTKQHIAAEHGETGTAPAGFPFGSLEEAAEAGYHAMTLNHGPGEVHALVEGPGIRCRVTAESKELALEQALESLNATLEQKARHAGANFGSRR